jgi:hypothetical protein
MEKGIQESTAERPASQSSFLGSRAWYNTLSNPACIIRNRVAVSAEPILYYVWCCWRSLPLGTTHVRVLQLIFSRFSNLWSNACVKKRFDGSIHTVCGECLNLFLNGTLASEYLR